MAIFINLRFSNIDEKKIFFFQIDVRGIYVFHGLRIYVVSAYKRLKCRFSQVSQPNRYGQSCAHKCRTFSVENNAFAKKTRLLAILSSLFPHLSSNMLSITIEEFVVKFSGFLTEQLNYQQTQKKFHMHIVFTKVKEMKKKGKLYSLKKNSLRQKKKTTNSKRKRLY